MARGSIEPEKITKPIQLVATWFAALVLLVGAFLGAANTAKRPAWLPVLFGFAAVLLVPLFVWLVFRLQTGHRPELMEDRFYSKYKAEEAKLKDFQPENVIGVKSDTGSAVYESEIFGSEVSEKDREDLQRERGEIFERNRGLFLIHTWRPSRMKGQVADISIRLHEHGKKLRPLSEGMVDRVAYYVGDYFFDGNTVTKRNAEDHFRLDISAYGSTDCVAKVYFKDGTNPVVLDRYLDFVS